MKHCLYIILFFGTLWMAASCRTTASGQAKFNQNGQPAVYTITVRIQDNGDVLNKVMEKVHQCPGLTEVSFNTNSNFMYQEKEILIKISSIPNRKIDEMKSSLYAIAGVIRVSSF